MEAKVGDLIIYQTYGAFDDTYKKYWNTEVSIVKENSLDYYNKRGNYEVATRGDRGYYDNYNYEVITNKDGYEPDTISKDVQTKDLEQEKEGRWGTSIKNKIDIVLKKK